MEHNKNFRIRHKHNKSPWSTHKERDLFCMDFAWSMREIVTTRDETKLLLRVLHDAIQWAYGPVQEEPETNEGSDAEDIILI